MSELAIEGCLHTVVDGDVMTFNEDGIWLSTYSHAPELVIYNRHTNETFYHPKCSKRMSVEACGTMAHVVGYNDQGQAEQCHIYTTSNLSFHHDCRIGELWTTLNNVVFNTKGPHNLCLLHLQNRRLIVETIDDTNALHAVELNVPSGCHVIRAGVLSHAIQTYILLVYRTSRKKIRVGLFSSVTGKMYNSYAIRHGGPPFCHYDVVFLRQFHFAVCGDEFVLEFQRLYRIEPDLDIRVNRFNGWMTFGEIWRFRREDEQEALAVQESNKYRGAMCKLNHQIGQLRAQLPNECRRSPRRPIQKKSLHRTAPIRTALIRTALIRTKLAQLTAERELQRQQQQQLRQKSPAQKFIEEDGYDPCMYATPEELEEGRALLRTITAEENGDGNDGDGNDDNDDNDDDHHDHLIEDIYPVNDLTATILWRRGRNGFHDCKQRPFSQMILTKKDIIAHPAKQVKRILLSN